MDYLEYLEHTRTLLQAYHDFEVRTAPPGCVVLPSLFSKIVESEIEVRRRANTPIQAWSCRHEDRHCDDDECRCPPPHDTPLHDPFCCTQCGEPIMYGERQHVCRGKA